MRVVRAGLLGLLVGGVALVGCTSGDDSGGENSVQSAPLSQPSNVAAPQRLEVWNLPGLPFALRAQDDPWISTLVLHATDARSWEDPKTASPEEESGREQLAASTTITVTVTGETDVGEGGLPGPSLRVILDSTQALAGLITPQVGVEITDLSQIPTILGIVDREGVFRTSDTLDSGPTELNGSNPEHLYFEPQDFSARGDWVAWREGSAGSSGELPVLDFDDWRIVAWNKTSGTPQEYASGHLLHGQRQAPRSSWNGAPTVDGQYIYFAAALPEALATGEDAKHPEPRWVTSVIRVPLDTPGAVEVVGAGVAPAANPSGGVYWVRGGTTMVSSRQDLEKEEIVEWEVETPGWSISSLAVEDNYVFASLTGANSQNAWILVWDMSTHQIVAALESVADWVELSAAGDLVAWGNGTANSDPSMYLWRVGDETITNLGATQGFSLPKVGESSLAVPRLTDSGAIIWELGRVDQSNR